MQSATPPVAPQSMILPGTAGLAPPVAPNPSVPVPSYVPGASGGAGAQQSLGDLFKPHGLAKMDPQGYGLKMAGSALKGLAQTLIQSENRPIDHTPRRLEISEGGQQRRGSRFDLGNFLSSLSNGGL